MHVLLATDGRPPAAAAESLLLTIADPARVEVTILHVDEYGNRLVADRVAEAVLRRSLERLTSAGIEAASRRRDGDVRRAIQHELDAGRYGLVAMGIGNTSWLGRLVLGGVSTFVLHRSSVPALIVQREPIAGRDRVRVVVGADGSPAADRAIDTLLELARPDSCDVFVRSVVEPPVAPPLGVIDPASIPSDVVETIAAEATDSAQQHADRARQRFEDAGFPCAADVVRGSAEVALLDLVHERDAELVVVGSRGLGRLAAAALGSVSAHAVRSSHAALVARAADDVPPPSE